MQAPPRPNQPQATPAVVAPQAPPPATTTVTIPALEARELTLKTNVDALTAQRVVLAQEMRTGSTGLRMSAEAQLLQLDLDLASNKAELSIVQTELASRMAQRTLPQPRIEVPPPLPRGILDRIDPDALTAAFIVTVLAVLMPLSIGISRRLWRRAQAPAGPPYEDKIAPRLDRLEQAVDAIAIEMERVSEGQRFVARVLSERPAPAPPNAAEPLEAASLGENQPFLALGAGPMEPIRVAERQGVRQSVTPH